MSVLSEIKSAIFDLSFTITSLDLQPSSPHKAPNAYVESVNNFSKTQLPLLKDIDIIPSSVMKPSAPQPVHTSTVTVTSPVKTVKVKKASKLDVVLAYFCGGEVAVSNQNAIHRAMNMIWFVIDFKQVGGVYICLCVCMCVYICVYVYVCVYMRIVTTCLWVG